QEGKQKALNRGIAGCWQPVRRGRRGRQNYVGPEILVEFSAAGQGRWRASITPDVKSCYEAAWTRLPAGCDPDTLRACRQQPLATQEAQGFREKLLAGTGKWGRD